jgi:hypothetical protein
MDLVKTARELLEIENDWQNHGWFAEEKFELITFKQIWSDTSGGFQALVVQNALITQQTYILFSCDKDNPHLVYFDGKFAYKVQYGDIIFEEDVANKNIAGKKDALTKYKVIK